MNQEPQPVLAAEVAEILRGEGVQDPNETVCARIDQALASEEIVVPAEIAAKVLTDMRKEQPKVLLAWLMIKAQYTMSTHVAHFLRDQRRRFDQDASAKFAQEWATYVDFLDTRYRVDNQHGQKRLRDMNAQDCQFVADSHTSRAIRHQNHAAFFAVLANKVGTQKVGDVYSEYHIRKVYEQLTGRQYAPEMQSA